MKTGLPLKDVIKGLQKGKHRYSHVHSAYIGGQLEEFWVKTLKPLPGGMCELSEQGSSLDSDGHAHHDGVRAIVPIRELAQRRYPKTHWIESPVKAKH